jgi:hypothetical protein
MLGSWSIGKKDYSHDAGSRKGQEANGSEASEVSGESMRLH